MLSYMLVLSLINIIFAFEPSCSSCKFFISNKNNPELGLCKRFKTTPYLNTNKIIYEFSMHCRNDENICGKSGLLYEPIDEPSDKLIEKQILDDYEELYNRCCGEVNEKDEIEQLEREFFEVYQKIKKYNKKILYNSAKEMYTFFKNNIL